ncbi:MAG: 50S ribosomal protein L3 [Candidatus Pacebacteria bacterium]|nr:50S ribosomal protein L3 [Candidatus Paceibacterota bacterium]MDD2757319.1 50S ribosomal protein L3 [Candidatus Paceibacterota bacterium]MDD3283483.1 50S ribosomal protein L3 [Candidatus Paceibacterota bacterium]MDD3969661.1 50S ribosomal protein L3 [Candidatus Paceibacterota bacterium]MDD4737891.1 50S ribosomal protein L3 [Candidatus Paceibacterota bacterium]
MKFILGKKIEMSQIFKEDGTVVPVTLVKTEECNVVQIKTKDNDGYEAIKLGFENLPERKIKKSGTPYRHLKEFKGDINEIKAGDKISLEIFQLGDRVKVSGVSKGKGFQGAVKRWGFSGKLTSSHGNKHEHRTLGSTGSCKPSRVVKGRKMPGRMGSDRVSVKNLEIVGIDKKNNIISIKGAIPGRRGTLLEIRG